MAGLGGPNYTAVDSQRLRELVMVRGLSHLPTPSRSRWSKHAVVVVTNTRGSGPGPPRGTEIKKGNGRQVPFSLWERGFELPDLPLSRRARFQYLTEKNA